MPRTANALSQNPPKHPTTPCRHDLFAALVSTFEDAVWVAMQPEVFDATTKRNVYRRLLKDARRVFRVNA